jgi:beta-glucosidase
MRAMMRATAALLLGLTMVVNAGGQSSASASDVDLRVEALLKNMTVEEKVGQMTQVALDVISKPEIGYDKLHQLDPLKLRTAIATHHVGSILNVMDHAYSVENWNQIINAIHEEAEKTRLKIPVLYGIDSIHGANYVQGAELFPQPLAMAATWDPELAERVGAVSALQTRAAGIPWTFYPVMDIGRQPLWPRFFETYGEDPLLASKMGTAYIKGLQGEDFGAPDKIAACLKHYAGYSFPFNGKDRTPAIIDERMMRQIFLPSFEAGVRAGAPTVMVNSGQVNGIPGHVNHHLLTDILKSEWQFKGFVVSDWQDIEELYTRDHVAATPKEAVRMAVMAGVDMSMVPLDFSFYDLLLENVREGAVPMSRIDDAVRRILRVKFEAGLFDRSTPDRAIARRFHNTEFEKLNRAVADEAITLLKNQNNTLPLRRGTKILVTGPTGDMLSVLNGGWSITWQGDDEQLYPKDRPTILRALQMAAGPENVQFVPGTTFSKAHDFSAAINAARSADVIVAALGEKAYCETPGNIEDLTLDRVQLDLVKKLAATGKPIIVVLAEGRPRVIHEIVSLTSAIVMAYLPGLEGGRAIADVLFGDVNPSGKLPFTYPASPNGFTTYDYKLPEQFDENHVSWEFPFGFGLSYTNFTYSDLRLTPTTLKPDGKLNAAVTVTNVGKRGGSEVVELYISQHYRSIVPPNRELKTFQKIALAPGEGRRLQFNIDAKDLRFVGLDDKWHLEPGGYTLTIGPLHSDFQVSTSR